MRSPPLISAADEIDSSVRILLKSPGASREEAKLQLVAQLTLEAGSFTFFSPHRPHFSGDVKVNIPWILRERGSSKEQNEKV